MMHFFKTVLMIINIISFIAVVAFGVFGVVEYILGSKGAENSLQKIGVTWGYNKVLLVGFICLAIMIISFIARKKLNGEM